MNDTLEKTDIRRTSVQNALATILSDDKFVAAPQMTAFLRYVVQQTLDGQSSRIKAYTVAVDALGKPSTFDPQNDPSVRVLAKRLRSSLDQYYERNPDVPLKIEMKAGSYIPAFVDSKKDDLPVPTAVSVSAPETAAQTASLQKTAATVPSSDNINTTNSQQNGERRQPSLAASDFSSSSAEKQTDTGIRADSSLNSKREKKPATSPQLSNTASSTSASSTAVPVNMLARKLSQVPRWALLALPVLVLVSVFWLTANKESATDSHVLAAAMPGADATSTLDISRARPTVPTILITTENATSCPCHIIADTLSTALLDSNTVDIYRETAMGSIELVWPEDYLLSVSSAKVGDRAHVSLQLLHAQSGQVIQADTIKLDASAESGFSIEDVDAIEAIANSFIENDSAMMRNFNAVRSDRLQTDSSSHDI